jgi:hypothetical protein
MKTYKLSTRNGLEEMLVHHSMQPVMLFDNLEDAIKAFEKEWEKLANTYTSFDDVDYNEDDVEESQKFHCRINLVIDGEVDFSSEGIQIEEDYTSAIFFKN